MPSKQQVLQKTALFYLEGLRVIEDIFREGPEANDRSLGLLGFSYELEQIRTSIHALDQAFQETGDIRFAELLLAYIDAGTEILVQGLALSEQKHWYELAIATARKVEDKEAEIRYLNNLALILSQVGENQGSIELMQERLNLARQSNNPVWIARALNELGEMYARNHELDQALACYREYFPIAGGLGDMRELAHAMGNTGLIWHQMGVLQEAMDAYQQTLQLEHKLRDHRGECIALRHIGDIYYDLRKYSQAQVYYEDALNLARQEMDIELLLPVQQGLGVIAFAQGRYADAMASYERYYQLSLEDGRLVNQAVVLGNIGEVFFKQFVFDKALEYFSRQQEIAVAINKKSHIASACLHIGLTYLKTNQRKQAADNLHRSMDIYRTLDVPYPAKLLIGLQILSFPNWVYGLYMLLVRIQARLSHFRRRGNS
jgi:tetratricopeptide (TPR) repeat protein